MAGHVGILGKATAAPPSGPPPVSGYVVWFDASDTSSITHSGGAVSQWNDLSGNGYHVTQATGGSKPTTGTVSINSLNAIDFDGSDDYLARTATQQIVNASDGTWSAFAVVQKGTNSGTDIAVASTPSGLFGAQMIRTNGTTVETVANNNSTYSTDTGGTIDTSPHQISAIQTAVSTIEVWLDGVSGGSSAKPGANAGVSVLSVGALMNTTAGGVIAGSYFDGAIAEVIIYPSALNSTDRQAVEDYLAAKWSTP